MQLLRLTGWKYSMLLMIVMRISSKRLDLRIFSLVVASVTYSVLALLLGFKAAFLMFSPRFFRAVICRKTTQDNMSAPPAPNCFTSRWKSAPPGNPRNLLHSCTASC